MVLLKIKINKEKSEGEFEFINRELDYTFSEDDLREIKVLIAKLQSAYLFPKEKEYMIKKCYYMPSWYWEWLENYKYNTSELSIQLIDNKLSIKAKGLLYRITLWEVPILALISKFIIDRRLLKNNKVFTKSVEIIEGFTSLNILSTLIRNSVKNEIDIKDLVNPLNIDLIKKLYK